MNQRQTVCLPGVDHWPIVSAAIGPSLAGHQANRFINKIKIDDSGNSVRLFFQLTATHTAHYRNGVSLVSIAVSLPSAPLSFATGSLSGLVRQRGRFLGVVARPMDP